MEHLKELYNTKREIFYELLKNKAKVTLKIDGTAFQVYYNKDTDEIEFHKRSGNSTKLGPIIDEFSRLMVKSYNTAIDNINAHKDIVKQYDLMIFEIFDDYMVLLSCVKDGKLLEDEDDLKKVAKAIDVKLVPVLFDGKLTIDQQNQIASWCNGDMDDDINFKQFIKELLDMPEVSKVSFPNQEYDKMGDNIEGVVFDFYTSSKIAQYKIVDPKFTQGIKDKKLNAKQSYEENKDNIQALQRYIQEYMESNVKKIDNDQWKSLNMNFINLLNNPKRWSKLIDLANKVPASNFTFNTDRLDSEISKLLRRGGVPMSIVYENYLLMYHKKKTRNYVIDKEFQSKINDVIDKL